MMQLFVRFPISDISDPRPILQKYMRDKRITVSMDFEYVITGDPDVIAEIKQELRGIGHDYYEWIGNGIVWNKEE